MSYFFVKISNIHTAKCSQYFCAIQLKASISYRAKSTSLMLLIFVYVVEVTHGHHK